MDFMEKMQKSLTQGVDASRQLFNKARERAQDLGEKGVLKFELRQLEDQTKNLSGKLGMAVYKTFIYDGQNTLSKNSPTIKKYLTELEDLDTRIKQKEDEIEKHG